VASQVVAADRQDHQVADHVAVAAAVVTVEVAVDKTALFIQLI
jgi:hypothetical protein